MQQRDQGVHAHPDQGAEKALHPAQCGESKMTAVLQDRHDSDQDPIGAHDAEGRRDRETDGRGEDDAEQDHAAFAAELEPRPLRVPPNRGVARTRRRHRERGQHDEVRRDTADGEHRHDETAIDSPAVPGLRRGDMSGHARQEDEEQRAGRPDAETQTEDARDDDHGEQRHQAQRERARGEHSDRGRRHEPQCDDGQERGTLTTAAIRQVEGGERPPDASSPRSPARRRA